MRRTVAALMLAGVVVLSGCTSSWGPNSLMSISDPPDDAPTPNLDLTEVTVAIGSKEPDRGRSDNTVTWARTDDAQLKPGDSLNFLAGGKGQVFLELSVGQKPNGDWTSTVTNGDLKTRCTRVTIAAREVSCVLPPNIQLPEQFGWTASTSSATGPEDFLPNEVGGVQKPIEHR